jgi:hypothetical protein
VSITLTNVRCGDCGVSIAPQVPDAWGPGDSFGHLCDCGHLNVIRFGGVRATTPARPDVLAVALSECSAAFDGVSSHGRARDVIEALRRGQVTIDPDTRATLERVMGRAG